ncbi:nuclease-related domain-containing protein [Kitasatospora sp. NPDC050467]|uniref:nuclease-related domain-containing protein n=1 Tax=Kitasatospora sp. NPDC050467 TaxID=3364053 RepID=UPI0037AF5FBC
MGAHLEALKATGWKVLHEVPLPSGADIDHVAIWPPGVFTVNSKHHPGATVWVGDKIVKVNRNGLPYLENSEFDARANRQPPDRMVRLQGARAPGDRCGGRPEDHLPRHPRRGRHRRRTDRLNPAVPAGGASPSQAGTDLQNRAASLRVGPDRQAEHVTPQLSRPTYDQQAMN